MKIKNIIILLSLSVTNLIVAQKGNFYFSLQEGGTKINDKNDFVSNSAKFGTSIKAGYVYNLNEQLGLGTGLEYAMYNLKSQVVNGDTYSTILIDDVGSAFEYRVKTTGYKEEQTLQAFQIPLFLQLKTALIASNSFYCRLGGKLVIPSKFEIDASANSVSGAGYYPDFNLLITDLPANGFGTQNNWKASGTYKTKLAYMASAELGFDFKTGAKTSIYTGFYLDYGLSNVVDNENPTSFVGYNSQSVNNRAANGVYSSDNISSKPFTFGVTLGINLGR
jgi:hypothetical protein